MTPDRTDDGRPRGERRRDKIVGVDYPDEGDGMAWDPDDPGEPVDPDDDPEDVRTWATSLAILDFLRGRRDNDVKVDLRGCLVPIKGIRYHSTADSYVIELVDGEDLRVALATDPLPTPPHTWDVASQTWTCLSCKQVSADPCQCKCHEESDVQFHGKSSVSLLLDHRRDCQCSPVKPFEEQLNNPRTQRLDPLCIAGVLVSDRRPS